ncbi:hypothetical protein [Clavibacter sp. VKM Ac-2872]|uniref:hypothetical protein n=1 Tax=Clavibacter sp. VKM Ac-2872 TaxID=2783812 RepID=UPI00188CE424|nr:hypothetical protein [Clavibacter sp. VKM Ac-2872]MBF4625784.1 hypothetical protein [Clavibacter sp. VKM Ac-2872]
MAQPLTPGDLHYITEIVGPLLEQFDDGMDNPDQCAQFKSHIRMLKPLLSVATVDVPQLLGCNFRQSIGGPLAERLAEADTRT